jgi:hypothetical protein
MSFDLSSLFSMMSLLLSHLWPFLAVPLGVLVGFALVGRVKRFLTMRAGVEKRRYF